MNIDLKGLKALVTGSPSGIGFATAARLIECGAEVVVNGRTPERVREAAARLRAAAPEAAIALASGDISTADGVSAVIDAAGEVDILVNNAAWIGFKPAFDIPDEDWVRSFEVNVL